MSTSILYEAHNLTAKAGTGIATYARSLARSARRLGYEADAVFGVERDLVPNRGRLNEILAFDAVPDYKYEPLWQSALRVARYPINAVGGLRPVLLRRSGLVVGPLADALLPFRNVFVATQLIDAAIAHFKIYGRLAQLRLVEQPSIFHATQPVPIAVKGRPNVYTIHDLVPLRLPYTTLENKKYFYRMLTKLAATADHIVTVSEYSRRDIIEFLGIDERRVTNTYQSVDMPENLMARSDDDVAHDLAQSFGLEFGGYFLFYGAIEPKKNVSRMIDAYAASGTKRPLIIVGGDGWHNRADLKKISDERFVSFRIDGKVLTRHSQVRRLRYLPQDQLVSLIRGARAVLFPSIYEGFGLPVVESMLLGTPVITSNVSSLPEIAGDAAMLVDPYSTQAISDAIVALDHDTDLCRDLADRGRKQANKFSPAVYDDRLRALYDALLR
jgi:glycosyltransferase involved in cell wall biosynthesis